MVVERGFEHNLAHNYPNLRVAATVNYVSRIQIFFLANKASKEDELLVTKVPALRVMK